MHINSSTILVVGAKGMLAGDLVPVLAQRGAALVLADMVESNLGSVPIFKLDITNRNQVTNFLQVHKPQVIVNCAAYTAVDKAEDDIETAFNVNAIGPGYLAREAKELGSILVHISSDYIFGGDRYLDRKEKPYKEDEIPSPCGIYGHSKRLGDELILATIPESSIIVRTSWLHGVNGPNFVDTIAKLGKERDELRVVDDQVGSPTWTGWLSETIAKLLEKDARGVFLASSCGNISWFEFAKGIVETSGGKANVLPQSTAVLGRKARRPFFSTLDTTKLENFLGEKCMSWKDDLSAHLKAGEKR